jgi:uncharacterized protein
MTPSSVLLLPGRDAATARHWLALWQHKFGYMRIEQHEWQRPLRGDWQIRLEDELSDRSEPVLFVAHDLGCWLVAAWAATSRHTHKVAGALLVAPCDVHVEPARTQLRSWQTTPIRPLPFTSVLVASANDPQCALDRAAELAGLWGAQFIDHGQSGHIDAQASLGSWPEGHVLLQGLMTLQ